MKHLTATWTFLCFLVKSLRHHHHEQHHIIIIIVPLARLPPLYFSQLVHSGKTTAPRVVLVLHFCCFAA